MKVVIPEEFKSALRIGTCSWKYDSWKGLYYDEQKKYRADDYLPDYTRYLNSVEIDQWFWSLFPGGIRLPESKTVKTYVESVPDDFVFTVKAPNAITLTHFYSRQPKKHAEFAGRVNEKFLSTDLLNRFLDRLSPMRDKLGPIMFQFEYLNRNKMKSKEVFMDRLEKFFEDAPRDFEYAVETRNPNYLSREFFDFMTRRRVAMVYLEGYYMPSIRDVLDEYHPATAQSAVIRLHGGDRLEIEEMTGSIWNRIAAPKPEGLSAAAQIVRANKEQGMRTYLNVNNHFEGCAPVTIERFLEVLREGN